jgi:hypothetical protein
MEVDLDGTIRLVGTTAVGPFGSPETFSVRVFPNPTTQNIHVMLTGSLDDVSLILYDALGKIVASKDHVSANSTDLDASALGAGFYWLEARNGDIYSRTKVVVTK